MANELRILIVLAVAAETFKLLGDAQSPVRRHIFLVEDTTAKGALEAIPYHYLNRSIYRDAKLSLAAMQGSGSSRAITTICSNFHP